MTVADALADDEAGYVLALDLKTEILERVPQPDCSVILQACCWLLADLITQAEQQKSAPVERAIVLTMNQLTSAVARLKLANAEAEAAEPVTH
jgi:hypothetical protein